MLANTRTERGFVLLLFSFCLASSTVGQRDLTQEGCGGLPESSPLRIQKADGQETMVAGRNIHRGELILSIPWRCVMSVEQVATELGGLLGSRVRLFAEREFQDWPQGFAFNVEEFVLFTGFVSELAKGNGSSYSHYFATLPAPEMLDGVIGWRTEEEKLLLATGLVELRGEVSGRLRRLFARVKRLLPEVFSSTIDGDMFSTAWAMFISRFFTVPQSPGDSCAKVHSTPRAGNMRCAAQGSASEWSGSQCERLSLPSNASHARCHAARPMLVPYLDKIDHCREAQGVWMLEGMRNDACVNLFAGKSFLAGQQVCHAYTWTMKAEEFLFRYGILDDHLSAAGWISFAQEEQIVGPGTRQKLSLLAERTGLPVFEQMAQEHGSWLGNEDEIHRWRISCRLRALVVSLDVMAAACHNVPTLCCFVALEDSELEARAWLLLRSLCLRNVDTARKHLGNLRRWAMRGSTSERTAARMRSIALLRKAQIRKLLKVAGLARSLAVRAIGVQFPELLRGNETG